MKLKHKCLLLACVLMVAAPAWADFTFDWTHNAQTINLTAISQVAVGGGTSNGAFPVSQQNFDVHGLYGGTFSGLPGYAFGNNPIFETFCVESQITFYPGTWYYASVDVNAYDGNEFGINGDPISRGSEWIYDQWLAGNSYGWLTGDVRDAIWALENETGGSTSGQAYQDMLTYGPANFAGNAWHTKALNLWTMTQDGMGNYHATDVQSHLITVIPVPGAILLGLIGLGMVQRVKRRIA